VFKKNGHDFRRYVVAWICGSKTVIAIKKNDKFYQA